jgi:hypothetical protein
MRRPFRPLGRRLRWRRSIITAFELRLSAAKLREDGEPTRGVPCNAIEGDDSPAAIQGRIEHTYEEWLEEEADRRRAFASSCSSKKYRRGFLIAHDRGQGALSATWGNPRF